MLILESLRSLHKFSGRLSGATDYYRAKTPRTQSKDSVILGTLRAFVRVTPISLILYFAPSAFFAVKSVVLVPCASASLDPAWFSLLTSR
jgi:hypothetical protein